MLFTAILSPRTRDNAWRTASGGGSQERTPRGQRCPAGLLLAGCWLLYLLKLCCKCACTLTYPAASGKGDGTKNPAKSSVSEVSIAGPKLRDGRSDESAKVYSAKGAPSILRTCRQLPARAILLPFTFLFIPTWNGQARQWLVSVVSNPTAASRMCLLPLFRLNELLPSSSDPSLLSLFFAHVHLASVRRGIGWCVLRESSSKLKHIGCPSRDEH